MPRCVNMLEMRFIKNSKLLSQIFDKQQLYGGHDISTTATILFGLPKDRSGESVTQCPKLLDPPCVVHLLLVMLVLELMSCW